MTGANTGCCGTCGKDLLGEDGIDTPSGAICLECFEKLGGRAKREILRFGCTANAYASFIEKISEATEKSLEPEPDGLSPLTREALACIVCHKNIGRLCYSCAMLKMQEVRRGPAQSKTPGLGALRSVLEDLIQTLSSNILLNGTGEELLQRLADIRPQEPESYKEMRERTNRLALEINELQGKLNDMEARACVAERRLLELVEARKVDEA